MEKITDEQLLNAVMEKYQLTGKVPCKRDFANKTTYQRRFKSWNNVLKLLNLPLNRESLPVPKTLKPCLFCGKDTKNDKFCSQSCSAKYNNQKFPKKQTNRLTICQCGSKKEPRSKVCRECSRTFQHKTIRETLRNGPDKFRLIREHARNTFLKICIQCESCEYNKHVEVCHIIPISQFPLDTLVSIVNHRDNIKILCPNCHWEFDHNKFNSP